VIAGVALLALSFAFVVKTVSGDRFEFDFRGDLYTAGQRIQHGLNPYQSLDARAAALRAGRNLGDAASPRYPPPVLIAAVPLSLLPFTVAAVLVLLLSFVSLVVALWLLEVRDWRCMAIACLAEPTFFGAWLGNISALLPLGAAVVWRYRARLWPPVVAVASMIAAKLFVWPLAVWLLVTKRFKTLALAVAIGGLGILVAWAVIGFRGLGTYPHLLANVSYIGEGRGNSLVAALLSFGLPRMIARSIALLCGLLLLGAAWRVSRRPHGTRSAFGLAVIAALVASPVVWSFYLVLAFVPIALLSPRFSWMWWLPMLATLEPGTRAHPHLLATVPALTIELTLIVWLTAPLFTTAIDGIALRPPAPASVRPELGR
jgi:hypothetical protein